MVNYACERCGWCTNIKTHFRNHLNRKYPCKPRLKKEPPDKIDEDMVKCVPVNPNVNPVSLNVNPNVQNAKNVNPNVNPRAKNVNPNVNPTVKNVNPNVNPNINIISVNNKNNNKNNKNNNKNNKNNNNKQYVCSKCFKSFTYRQSKYRHEKNYCKKILLCNQEKLLQELEAVKNEKKEQLKLITQMKETHMKEIDNLLDKVGDTINNTNNTYIKEQNIIINNYGQEDIEYLTEAYLKKLSNIHPSVAINLLIKNIHCHPKHPENHNIKITNKKLPYASIYKDGDWIVEDKKKVIKDIVNTSFNIIDEKYSSTIDITNRKKETFKQFQKQYENDDKHLHKDLQKTAEILIMNNSNK